MLYQSSQPQKMSLREELKHRTRELHDQVEKKSPMTELMSPHITRERMDQVLLIFYRWLAPMERLLEQKMSDAPGRLSWDTPHQSSLYIRDLRKLFADSNVFYSKNLPVLNSIQETWGACYVLEGSHFGMGMISRHLAKVIGTDIIEKRALFSQRSEEPAQRWKRFCVQLESVPIANGNFDLVVNGARQTYHSLENHFEEIAHKPA